MRANWRSGLTGLAAIAMLMVQTPTALRPERVQAHVDVGATTAISSPSAHAIAAALRPDVELVIAAYNANAGYDTTDTARPTAQSPFEQWVRAQWPNSWARAELEYLRADYSGHLLAYGVWLRHSYGGQDPSPLALRGWVERFAADAENTKMAGPIDQQQRASTDPDAFLRLARAVSGRYGTGDGLEAADRLVGRYLDGDPWLSADQRWYAREALDVDPGEAVRVCWAALEPQLGGFGADEMRQAMRDAAQRWLYDSGLQQVPVYRYLRQSRVCGA